jgi:hypothetical protein
MNNYHITYFIDTKKPVLTGITIKAETIQQALNEFLFQDVEPTYEKVLKREKLIKYIVKL